MLGSAESEVVRQISREIIFQEFEPIWSRYLNVTDGRTDRRTDRRTTCHGNTALRVASRGKNEERRGREKGEQEIRKKGEGEKGMGEGDRGIDRNEKFLLQAGSSV